MKSYNASYFKNHFGAVMDRAGMEPVRIQRRGREPAVLIPESEYQALRSRSPSSGQEAGSALSRLKAMALGQEVDSGPLRADPRAEAILRKHS